MRAFITRTSAAALIAFAATAVTAGAQEATLEQAKSLYAEAAYEDVLRVLSNLSPGESATEAGRYRAACLLALGRTDEARKAVDDVVAADPEYVPDRAETSRRVLELFRTTRQAKLPEIAKGAYAEAKAALDRDQVGTAIAGFEKVIRLTDDADLADDSVLSELKMLAAGFLELTRSRAAAAKPAAPSPVEPITPVAAPPVVTPAAPISQKLPPWTPPLGVEREFTGAIRVEIGADGKVTSASLEKSVHPTYDALLLAAARKWIYEPARQNGVAVPTDRLVEIKLKPRDP